MMRTVYDLNHGRIHSPTECSDAPGRLQLARGYICDLLKNFIAGLMDYGALLLFRAYWAKYYCKVIKDECIRESGRLCPWSNIQIVLEGRIKDNKEVEVVASCLKQLVWKVFG